MPASKGLYEDLAKDVKGWLKPTRENAKFLRNMMHSLKRDNRNFNYVLFVTACGDEWFEFFIPHDDGTVTLVPQLSIPQTTLDAMKADGIIPS